MSVVVSGLSKIYGTQRAVDDISFSAKPGEILGFLGPNGAGKTTTMKMICCYSTPSEGTASVEGYDIIKSPLSVRSNIGYLPEHNPLYEEMYVKEFLQFVASIHKISDKTKRIAEVIELTGLGHEQHKIIGTLSKGYRQRVGIAQAIIHDPKVLILDEPTSGLDMNQLLDIRTLIKELGKEKTLIFSSHIMQEVEALCDRVVILNHGVIVADESIQSLRSKIAGQTEIRVTFAQADINLDAFAAIPNVERILRKEDGYLIIVSGERDIRSQIFETAVYQQLTIIEMYKEKANVEDVFRKLTKNTADV